MYKLSPYQEVTPRAYRPSVPYVGAREGMLIEPPLRPGMVITFQESPPG